MYQYRLLKNSEKLLQFALTYQNLSAHEEQMVS